MPYKKSNINEKDNSFSIFARALGTPVRVQIVRLIIENGFTINKDNLYSPDFAPATINKHIDELRAMGVLKREGNKGQVSYNIDQNWFTHMINEFMMFFGKGIFPQQPNQMINQIPENAVSVIKETTKQQLPAHPHFGAFIKMHRENFHITQETFAKKIKISREHLSRIECGKKTIGLDKLRAISKALGLNYRDIRKEYYSYQLAENNEIE